MISHFVDAISIFREIQFIVTKSNADQGGAEINRLLDLAALRVENIHVFASLGVKRYLSLMKYSEFVLGNSSSGIIEAPSFHIPTVNIGNRQRGRLQTDSVINCDSNKESLIEAINKAMNDDFREKCNNTISPYGDGNASKRIAQKTVEIVKKGGIDLKKSFYDIV